MSAADENDKTSSFLKYFSLGLIWKHVAHLNCGSIFQNVIIHMCVYTCKNKNDSTNKRNRKEFYRNIKIPPYY